MPIKRPKTISDESVEQVCARIVEGKRVRRHLPVWGRLHIDRQLPFLCVYRRPGQREDSGTSRLILGEASYLIARGDRRWHEQTSTLVRRIAETLKEIFGGFLILEIWSSPDEAGADSDAAGVLRPAFRIVRPKTDGLTGTVEVLENALSEGTIRRQSPEVTVLSASRVSPHGLAPLLTSKEAAESGIAVLGLEIRPIYRDPKKGTQYPLLLRSVHRVLYRSFKRSFYEFTRSRTTHLPLNYQALGRRALVKAVWQVDRALAEVSNTYDFLLGVTPVNSQQAWNSFKRSGFRRVPAFIYRPLPVSPALLQRKLFAIPVERVEDPVLTRIFREKQSELNRQLSGLSERETKRFLYVSLQLFGTVDDKLMEAAEELLDQTPPHSREKSAKRVGASVFAERAEEEYAYFRRSYPEFSAKVRLRNDITGLMVSRGNLLVARDAKIPLSRVEALIQHEVGTHVLTYHNGRSQPFRQLYSGLAGYEELQEGLAVLAEYLTGGLSLPRVRLLAARVVAARRMVDGADFVETFRELDRNYELSSQLAFNITMRVFRGGGLTKDAVYLRGLIQLHRYLRGGGTLEPLLVGKISQEHVSIVQELLWRKVLHPSPLRPRYLDDPQAIQRLEQFRGAKSVLALIRKRSKR